MRRLTMIALTATAVTVAGAALAVGSSEGSHPRAAVTRAKVCPHARALPGDALAPATRAALFAVTHTDSTELNDDRRDAIATSALLGPYARGDAATVRDLCGRSMVQRTVVVNLFFPRMLPSAAASVTTVYVAQAKAGTYKVWYIPRG